jgi:hypothetical protein
MDTPRNNSGCILFFYFFVSIDETLLDATLVFGLFCFFFFFSLFFGLLSPILSSYR